MKKKFYETPEAELFTVRFEGNLMQGSPYGSMGAAGGKMKMVYYDDDDEF